MVVSDHDDHFSRFLDVIKRSDRKVESRGRLGGGSERSGSRAEGVRSAFIGFQLGKLSDHTCPSTHGVRLVIRHILHKVPMTILHRGMHAQWISFFLPKKGSLVIFLTKKVKYENDKKCMEAKTNEAFGI